MAKLGLYFSTIVRLSGKQVLYQCLHRLRGKCRSLLSLKHRFDYYKEGEVLKLATPVSKYESCKGDVFTFLNQSSSFTGVWNIDERGPLWNFNINYMEYLLQPSMSPEDGKKWIFRFIDGEVSNSVGMASYCISLRIVNWIKFITINREIFTPEELKRVDTSLYSQYRILSSNLEYHLAGNHLLENIFTLLWAAYYFNDHKGYRKAAAMLEKELDEQTLSDGANYEQSPMYHCIILDRVLDSINLVKNNKAFPNGWRLIDFLKRKAELMLGWLATISYADGSFPLFNDSAIGIAPTATQLFGYATRLGLKWSSGDSSASGYYVANGSGYELRMDMGGITASYIPGHSHADTFNFELRVQGKPYIVDTGISTYDVCERRFYERSTAAHNTVVVGGADSSRVWSAFRCAQRARVFAVNRGDNSVAASHNGYKSLGTIHSRCFQWSENGISIVDTLSGNAKGKAYFHFASGVDVEACGNILHIQLGEISFDNASEIEILDSNTAVTYNIMQPGKCVAVSFTGTLSTHFVLV